ncbi:MAG: hypothetical protein HZY75_13390 [Nocardioidaceae bacterium]|nr:MAG: hypothetical protein HZY75_13390 [Nocardioidaceae bacterium]
MLALPLVIDADAAMLGERADLGEYAIANDPQGVAESDPANAYTRLPEIKGDLPAPLHVRVGDTGSLQPLLVTASSWPRRMWAQTSTVTGGSTGSDATASAGSYVTRTLTSSYQQVARATIDNIWHAGRYRVLARVRTSGAGGENIRFRLVNGEARKLATGEWTVVDLGVIAVPGATCRRRARRRSGRRRSIWRRCGLVGRRRCMWTIWRWRRRRSRASR